ncbi:metallophosphoesterase [Streptomyces sp. NPDC091267]|uniref:metallophosphoesterase family protein n=1 Tax=Streptomyces sp. NPDC091267 TaxID=3155195 RepID=UPI00343D5546
MRILHLSDTHLDRVDAPNARGVNATQVLSGLLGDLTGPVVLDGLDVVVVSGDLADDGSPEAYATVRELVGAYAAARNVPVVYSTGNHDERQAFTKVLGSGHLSPSGEDRAEDVVSSPAGERAAVSHIGGYRFITLDSLVPGKGYGRISRAQLDWLRQILEVPAPEGTVLVFHHPPVTLDVAVQQALGLADPADLAEVIRGTDVHTVLCGHFHLQLSGRLEQAAVWVTPGVVNRIDLTSAPGTERAVRGGSATVIDLGGPHSPLIHTLHARDPRAGETVYDLDGEQLARVIADLGPEGHA